MRKMPGKPTSEQNAQVPQEVMEQSQNEYPEQVTRELTQTDQLNKKLLTSFLQRMNNSAEGLTSHNQIYNREQNGDSPCNTPEN